MITIAELQKQVHATAREKGWWPIADVVDRKISPTIVAPIDFSKVNVPEKIALMHSELSEALEEFRRDGMRELYFDTQHGMKPEGIAVEFADCIIRILDFCGAYGIDLEDALITKMAYNKTRPYRHGGKKA